MMGVAYPEPCTRIVRLQLGCGLLDSWHQKAGQSVPRDSRIGVAGITSTEQLWSVMGNDSYFQALGRAGKLTGRFRFRPVTTNCQHAASPST